MSSVLLKRTLKIRHADTSFLYLPLAHTRSTHSSHSHTSHLPTLPSRHHVLIPHLAPSTHQLQPLTPAIHSLTHPPTHSRRIYTVQARYLSQRLLSRIFDRHTARVSVRPRCLCCKHPLAHSLTSHHCRRCKFGPWVQRLLLDRLRRTACELELRALFVSERQ